MDSSAHRILQEGQTDRRTGSEWHWWGFANIHTISLAAEKFYVNSFAPVTKESSFILPRRLLLQWTEYRPGVYIQTLATSNCTLGYYWSSGHSSESLFLHLRGQYFVSILLRLTLWIHNWHLQDSRALGADERADGHVDVCGAPLATIEALAVARQRSQLTKCLQVAIILLFPDRGRHPLGLEIE